MTHFFYWWHQIPQHIYPVFLAIGPLQIRYYGLMYLTALLVGYFNVRNRIRKGKTQLCPINLLQWEDYFLVAVLSIIVGARLGYVLFYDFDYFVKRPAEIFWPFQPGFRFVGISGLSYHGGLIGIIGASVIFCRIKKIHLWKLADFVIPAVPLGYTFGRIGNFLNGELYGRVTNVPWGMVFPQAPDGQLRHPSQLYEALFEGIFLFCLLRFFQNKKSFDGFLFFLYLMGYGAVRFGIEFFREPDAQLGFVFGSFSMGQLLCLFMMLTGGVFMLWRGNVKEQGT